MWGEPSPDARVDSGIAKLDSDRGGCAGSAAGRAAEHAEQRAWRHAWPELEPRSELFPCPAVHPDLTSLAALPATNENRAA
jgi:hypothetical protein